MTEVDIEKQLTALADFVFGQHGEDVNRALPEFLDEVAASGLLDTMFRQNYSICTTCGLVVNGSETWWRQAK